MQLVAELAIVTWGFPGQEAISDGRWFRGGETICRGQRDERGVIGVRVEASSSQEREEL